MWDRRTLRIGVTRVGLVAGLTFVLAAAPAFQQPAEAASRNDPNPGASIGAAFMKTLNEMTRPAKPQRRKTAAKRPPEDGGPSQIVKPQVAPLVNVADSDIDPFAEPVQQAGPVPQAAAVADHK
ncbi:hypothetical protein GCM10007301_56120 [Azorhizobium oxalatiphilum]|uniref:Uncharacterized protein n=1 Tax=Azorhizobium oxalatiphilum TaxID=980631 RepID=A0A917CIR8_9HYPH|nr:hypothetical protein [Azorhizobium oxalatiphilum]GGF88984.1 hypothetical protein GCM10007301_56120 [Azorhizobium oxalatiphilum]